MPERYLARPLLDRYLIQAKGRRGKERRAAVATGTVSVKTTVICQLPAGVLAVVTTESVPLAVE